MWSDSSAYYLCRSRPVTLFLGGFLLRHKYVFLSYKIVADDHIMLYRSHQPLRHIVVIITSRSIAHTKVKVVGV